MPRATLKQRPDGRYACKYKGRFFYGSTQSEAYQARDAYKNMLQQGLKAENLGLTVRQYAMRWLSIRKADTPNKDMYAHHMNRLLDLVGDRLMRDVDASDIKAYYNQYIGMSQSSINKARITVNGFFVMPLLIASSSLIHAFLFLLQRDTAALTAPSPQTNAN